MDAIIRRAMLTVIQSTIKAATREATGTAGAMVITASPHVAPIQRGRYAVPLIDLY